MRNKIEILNSYSELAKVFVDRKIGKQELGLTMRRDSLLLEVLVDIRDTLNNLSVDVYVKEK